MNTIKVIYANYKSSHDLPNKLVYLQRS